MTGVHLRRALLLFAIVLGVSALIAALFPVERRDRRGADSSSQKPAAPLPPPPPTRAKAIRFEAGAKPHTETVEPGTRLLLKVAVPKAGEVTLQGKGALGEVAAAEAGTPAVFDLFLEQPQSFDVTYTQSGAEATRVGTITVAR